MHRTRATTAQLQTHCAKVLLLVMLLNAGLATSGESGKREEWTKINLKLVAEYKQNQLEDVSSDGRLMVFFQTSRPMRTFTYRPGRGAEGDRPETHDELLRAVDLESGREVNNV